MQNENQNGNRRQTSVSSAYRQNDKQRQSTERRKNAGQRQSTEQGKNSGTRQSVGSQQNARKRKSMSRRRRKKQKRNRILAGIAAAVVVVCAVCGGIIYKNSSVRAYAEEYENVYNSSLYQGELFASDLCVTTGNVDLEGFTGDSALHAAGLFDINQQKVLYADRIFERIYPASTTKILTAYVALKYGNMDDIVTVGPSAVDLEADASVCGLQEGDQISMYDLMCGLLLYSGNDSAIAIAEHISGTEEAFVDVMNEEALALGATGTHFTNSHGLHEEEHYTTAYDLYLMFQACVENSVFVEILSKDSHTASITGADGSVRTEEWYPSNYYSAGLAEAPDGVRVLGGKTGTTDEAGSCVVLYNEDMAENPYISIIMGASDKTILYDDMSALLSAGVAGQ